MAVENSVVHEPPSSKGSQDVVDFVCEEEPHMLDVTVSGGYMPVTLGSLLNEGKYEVVRKLGWGASSSVWLARQTQKDFSGPYHVAIKILTVKATLEEANNFSEEMNIYTLLVKHRKEYAGIMNCQMLLDCFLTQSTHGDHWCFVLDAYGSTIHDMHRELPQGRFALSAVKNIIRQILVALDALHSLGVVHTDVKTQNMFIVLPRSTRSGIHGWLLDHPAETYPPRHESRLAPEPIVTVKSQPLPQFGLESFDTVGVHLGDFGCARFIEDMSPGLVGQPVRLRAPDVVLGHEWSTAVDVWSVGCIIYELLTHQPFFDVDQTDSEVDYAYLQQIRDKVGPFPPDFIARCIRKDRYFDTQGALRAGSQATAQAVPSSILRILEHDTDLLDDDLRSTAAFMKRCLEIDPHKRANAAELLKDDWFAGVCDTIRNPFIVE